MYNEKFFIKFFNVEGSCIDIVYGLSREQAIVLLDCWYYINSDSNIPAPKVYDEYLFEEEENFYS